MRFIGKKILVIGMARSGVAVASLLSRHGANVIINDRKTEKELGSALDELKGLNIEWRLGDDPVELVEHVDGVVISPGVPITASAARRNLTYRSRVKSRSHTDCRAAAWWA